MVQEVLQRFAGGMVGRLVIGGVAVLTSVRYGAGLYFWRQTEALERPSYTVIKKLSDGVELRRYEPYLIAETTVNGAGFREPTADGFRACAGYIFGENKPRRQRSDEGEKMAMTAPVRVSQSNPPVGEKMSMTAPVRVQGGAQKTKVSFVMGKNYTLKSLPRPRDSSVKLRQVPAHTLAVRTFSGGPPKDERVELEREKIERALDKAGMKPNQPQTLVYGYHDPFITPKFLRRNEVALVIEGKV